ncbi:MAG: two-component regulator propeller domain-containing protein [Nitrospinaceae bacterium]
MKRLYIFLFFSLVSGLFSVPSRAFDKPLASTTTGKDYPHILRTDEFSLNTRNIKVLTAQGKYLWMGTSHGVIRYDTTTAIGYELFDNQNALLSNGIFSIVLDKNHHAWVGTYGGGLSHYDGTRWVNINTPQGLCDSFVYDLEFLGDTMWIATWSGVNRVSGDPFSRQSWKSFTVENTHGGLIDDWVYALEIGKDRRIWFGTESGISVFDGTKWRNWDHTRGLGAEYETVKADNRGVVSPFQGGHHATHGPGLPNLGSQDYRPNYVVSMRLDQKNRLWIGTWGGGLSVFDTRTFRFRNFTVRDGLPGNYILAIEEGPLGNLWIGSNGGLSRFDGKTFLNYSELNGLASNFTFSIEFAPDHSLWLGGHSAMNRLKIDPLSGKLGKVD